MSDVTSVPTAPLELPRLVMRRAAWVALAALLTALALGLWRSGADIDEETRSALSLAGALAQIIEGAQHDGAALPGALTQLEREGELRHVTLTLRDAQQRVRFDSSRAEDRAAPSWLAWLDRPWRGGDALPLQQQTIALPQRDGSAWMLQVAAARHSERREAMAGLAQMLALVAAGSVAMLAVMAWNMRRAFAPMQTLVDAIERLRSGAAPDTGALAAAMPIRELQTIAQALHGLQRALHDEATQRRVLSQQVLTLQEDERQRLAQELHDEFGQHLTALHADAAWLSSRLASNPGMAQVAKGIAQHCATLQQHIRSMLTRLQPLALRSPHDVVAAIEPAYRLAELLQALVHSWSGSATQACAFELTTLRRTADGRTQPWPRAQDPLDLPRELVLAIYRMSQEGLTNVARHSRAGSAALLLVLNTDAADRATSLEWTLRDDGIGLPEPAHALQHGAGLAGLKERAWAQGAELHIGPAAERAERPGLLLAARFELPVVA